MLHAEFPHHPSRRGIPSEVRGIDTLQAKDIEAPPNYGRCRLRAVPIIPVGFPDPISKLRPSVLGPYPEPDGTDQLLSRSNSDGKDRLLPLLKLFLVGGNPLFGHAVFVGMRNVESGCRNIPVASQALPHGCIKYTPGTMQTAFRGSALGRR